MGLKRRTFLQQLGFGLTALGVSEAGLWALTERYQQALAVPTRRKLALLVGINQYPEEVCDFAPARGPQLKGCVTDVELQRELLIHRFGFSPSDILTLTDGQATRQEIEAAFLGHLTEQARPGDVVVFHFSGYGSQIRLESGDIQQSLVPIDGILPTERRPGVNDLMEQTLWLLLRSLKTKQVTTVLDLSYADTGLSVNTGLRTRSRPNIPTGQPNPDELNLQAQLIAQLRNQPQNSDFGPRGVVLRGAGADQVAAEGQWHGFSAGLFTYALTQQLWWATPAVTVPILLPQTATEIERRFSQQQPRIQGQLPKGGLPYHLAPVLPASADGVIRSGSDNSRDVQLWLGGLPLDILENYGISSVLTVLPPAPILNSAPAAPAVTNSPAPSAAELTQTTSNAAELAAASLGTSAKPLSLHRLQIRAQDGLMARARSCCQDAAAVPLEPGQFVQETIRVIPGSIDLDVALDPALERIERVDATSAFASLEQVSSVAGEQSADCLFGKADQLQTGTLTAALLAEADGQDNEASEQSSSDNTSQPSRVDQLTSKTGYGLFSLGHVAIPNTLTDEEEAVKTAVKRLTPRFHLLLAKKLLQLTANDGTSCLGVQATLERLTPEIEPILQQWALRAPSPTPRPSLSATTNELGQLVQLAREDQIQYRLQNYGDTPVYFVLLGFDSSGGAIALYPDTDSGSGSEPAETQMLASIPPGETRVIPGISKWFVRGPAGNARTYLIFGRQPFTQTITTLTEAMPSASSARQIRPLDQSLPVAKAVLTDLARGSDTSLAAASFPSDAYALNVADWATLSFAYQVV